jgi:hypothetical protein
LLWMSLQILQLISLCSLRSLHSCHPSVFRNSFFLLMVQEVILFRWEMLISIRGIVLETLPLRDTSQYRDWIGKSRPPVKGKGSWFMFNSVSFHALVLEGGGIGLGTSVDALFPFAWWDPGEVNAAEKEAFLENFWLLAS